MQIITALTSICSGITVDGVSAVFHHDWLTKINQAIDDSTAPQIFCIFPLVETPEIAVLTACWFWFTRHLNDLADKDEFKAITQKINGGLNGLAERKYFLDKAKMCITSECFIVIPNNYEN